MIKLEHISKTFAADDGHKVYACKDVNITVAKGEIYGIIGFSGAGKSTLVRCINLLGKPDSGTVTVDGKDLLSLSAKELREERKKIGMIFQHFNLMKSRTVFDNVAFPLKHSGLSKEETAKKVRELLALVEISEKETSYPSELSGGQQQRVAIARALANNPKILLCDEATSALDPTTTKSILALLKKLRRDLNLTIVVITHQMNVIKEICDKVAVMENGVVVEQGEVYTIFANPQNEATKNFIKSTSNLAKVEELLRDCSDVTKINEDEKIVRLSYRKKNISEPLLSELTVEFAVVPNIIFADIEIVQEAPIGGTVAILSGKEKALSAAIDWLRQKDVGVEVLAG